MNQPLEIQALGHRFGDFEALKRVSLSVPPRSVFGFLGPNGAGKTTTIRCLLGLLRAQTGSIRIDGHDVLTQRRQALASVGAVVETPALFPNLTGRENLEVTRRILKIDTGAVDRALDIIDMRDAADRRVGHYSLGMRQRLGLARALLARPRLLVLDEPTNGLDPAGIRDMRTLIKALPEREDTTVFMSSHLLSEVELTATHAGLMKAGEIVFEGSLNDLAERQPSQVRLETDDDTRASEIAIARGFDVHPRDGSGLALSSNTPIDRDRTAALNTALVEAGLQVSTLLLERGDLETVFMSLTGAIEEAG